MAMSNTVPKGLSLGKVAGYCGVTRKTILRWVNVGMLESFQLPSGHHRVLPRDIVSFLQKNNMPVPIDLACDTKPSVLIVDAEAQMRQLVSDILKPYFIAVEATNGIDACIKMGVSVPDLLITDIKMPGMDGIALCHQIRKEDQLKNMKIVILSSHITSDNRVVLSNLSDALMAKPFAAKELLLTCLSACGRVLV